MDYKKIGFWEGARELLARLPRFCVLREMVEGPPMLAFRALLKGLLNQEADIAAEQYHIMIHTLLTGDYRRVSGDLFYDYMLHYLLERENAFSRLAAKGEWDEALSYAMRADLSLTDALFGVNSATIKKWIGECAKEGKTRPRTKADNIAMMSTAVWSGNVRKPLPASSEKEPEQKEAVSSGISEEGFLSWRYRIEPVFEDYVSDTVLEELYRRFLSSDDRGMLLDDLWNFHSSCGTGQFIRDRLFMLEEGGALSPVTLGAEPESFGLYKHQRELALKNTIRFMQGEHNDNMLVLGGAGAGKTTLMFALLRELPELRLILCPPLRLKDFAGIAQKTLGQPYKFMLLLDDFDPDDKHWPALRASIAPSGTQPDNILIAACARQGDDPFFPLKLRLEAPELKEFIELVRQILLKAGKEADYDRIQNACIDYAAAAGASGGSPLSYRSAGLIAQSLYN